MLFRKFWLVNGNGEKFEDIRESFHWGDPNGLGMQTSLTTVRLGDNSLVTYEERQLIDKTFELRFYNGIIKSYKAYNDFSLFILSNPLYLYYLPPHLKSPLFCTVKVTSLDKGEIGTDGVLRCAITLQPITLWKDYSEHVIAAYNTIQDGGKNYELVRPYVYTINTLSNISVYNEGVDNAPFEIEIVGDVTDPQYNLFSSDETKYGVGKFNGSFERVYVNSDDAEESIVLESEGSVLANPYNYQDLTIGAGENVQTTFLKLKHGKNLISFVVNSDFDGVIYVRWRNEYATI